MSRASTAEAAAGSGGACTPPTPSSPHLMRRQRSLVSTFLAAPASVCRSGRSDQYSLSSSYDLFLRLPSRKDLQLIGWEFPPLRRYGAPAWQERSFRRLGSRKFRLSSRGLPALCNGGAFPELPADDEVEEVAYCKPSPWKLFIRKIRAETKKMNCASACSPAAPGFHYDALSYAMNFDDGRSNCQPSQLHEHYFECDSSSSDNMQADNAPPVNTWPSYHPAAPRKFFW